LYHTLRLCLFRLFLGLSFPFTCSKYPCIINMQAEEAAAEAAPAAGYPDVNTGAEYEFVAEGQVRQPGDTQALAPATEEQAVDMEGLLREHKQGVQYGLLASPDVASNCAP
jgi:hypothetical protein